MIRMRIRVFVAAAAAAAGVLLAAAQARAVPVFVDYDVAGTGQSARAGFEFLDATTLQISLFETTPAGASDLTGGSAILTSLGFLLPRVQITGGSASLMPGSTTAGFDLGGGTDISNLWGYTPTTLPERCKRTNSLFLSLALSDTLQLSEQTDFLNALPTRTMVGYGSGGIIGGTLRGLPPTTEVPEPPIPDRDKGDKRRRTITALVGASRTSVTCVTFHLSLEFTIDPARGECLSPNVLFQFCFPQSAQVLQIRSPSANTCGSY